MQRTEVLFMREQTYHIYLDSHEKTTLLHSLVELKNQLIQQGRYTDCVDELIFKVANAPVDLFKVNDHLILIGIFLELRNQLSGVYRMCNAQSRSVTGMQPCAEARGRCGQSRPPGTYGSAETAPVRDSQ